MVRVFAFSLVAASLVAASMVAATAAAQLAPIGGSVSAYDANGGLVGAVVPIVNSSRVDGLVRLELTGVGDLWLGVAQYRGGVRWTSAPIYYTDSACAGIPFATFSPRSIASRTAFVGLGNQLFLGVNDASGEVDRLFRSRTSFDADGQVVCVAASSGLLPVKAVLLEPSIDLDDAVALPMTIRSPRRVRATGGE